MAHRIWTEQEDALLVEMYPQLGADVVAQKLSRSRMAIAHRSRRLGVKYAGNFVWTPEKDDRLRYLYAQINMSVGAIAGELGCDYRNLYARLRALGIRPCKRANWTEEKDTILRNRFPNEGTSQDLCNILCCTVGMIYKRASKLGIKFVKSKCRAWTEEDVAIFKQRFPLEGASKALRTTLNRTQRSLLIQGATMGLKIEKNVLRQIYSQTASSREHCHRFKGYKEISGNFLNSLRRGAKSRNLAHPLLDGSLTNNQYIYDLFLSQNRRCALTGVPIYFALKSREKGSASLDRIDSSKGYEVGNVQWVHKEINMLKRAVPQEDFIVWANRIAKKHPRITTDDGSQSVIFS